MWKGCLLALCNTFITIHLLRSLLPNTKVQKWTQFKTASKYWRVYKIAINKNKFRRPMLFFKIGKKLRCGRHGVLFAWCNVSCLWRVFSLFQKECWVKWIRCVMEICMFHCQTTWVRDKPKVIQEQWKMQLTIILPPKNFRSNIVWSSTERASYIARPQSFL